MNAADGTPIAQMRVAVPAKPEGLEDLHTAFDHFFAEVEPDALSFEDRIALITAAGEVAANIVEHACSHLPDAEMLVELYARSGGFEIAFTDHGTEFDTTVDHTAETEEAPPDEAEGGRGLAVVRASVDEVAYSRVDDTNRWRLLRNRRT
jgi:anti-sigma regulatory factor (Ser/Thr protein kinase)